MDGEFILVRGYLSKIKLSTSKKKLPLGSLKL